MNIFDKNEMLHLYLRILPMLGAYSFIIKIVIPVYRIYTKSRAKKLRRLFGNKYSLGFCEINI